MTRELRPLTTFEVIAVVAIAVAPWPELVPAALPLLVVGTLSRWARGRSWAEVSRARASHVAIGLVAGAAALALAVLVTSRGLAALSGRSFTWSEHAIVRGNPRLVATVALYVAVTAIAAELALRGWIVERVLELAPGPPTMAIVTGALAEALVTPGGAVSRAGAALFGAGLGWMYVAGGRSVVGPACARIAFQAGAVVLEGLKS